MGINDHLVLKYILHKCCRLPFDIHCLECHKGQNKCYSNFSLIFWSIFSILNKIVWACAENQTELPDWFSFGDFFLLQLILAFSELKRP
jgi:hypothetical protein